MAKQWLKYKTEIYGLCAIWVILFHISRRVGVPGNLPVITSFIIQGNAAVDVFMLLSGICGYLSFQNKSWKDYYKKRFVRVVIPYLIISTPFWIWKSIVEVPISGSFNWKVFIKDITTISLWKEGTTTVWFVAGICLFYFLVPFLDFIINKGKRVFLALLVVILALNIIGIFWVPMYYYACLVWARFPAFIVGYYIGKTMNYEETGDELKRSRWIKVICVVVVFIGLIVLQVGEIDYGLKDNRGIAYLLYELLALPVVVLLAELCKVISQVQILSRLIKSIGTVSLEIYMIHVFIIRLVAFYDGFDKLGVYSYPMILIAAYIISLIVSKIITSLLNKKTLGELFKKEREKDAVYRK